MSSDVDAVDSVLRRCKAAKAIDSGPTGHAADPCGVVSLLDVVKYRAYLDVPVCISNVRFHE
jgi:hypothetical protein